MKQELLSPFTDKDTKAQEWELTDLQSQLVEMYLVLKITFSALKF